MKLDRLTRSVRDLADLVDGYFSKRAALLSVSEQIDTRSAAGRLVLNVLSSVGQWEREAIGERTSIAMQHNGPRASTSAARPVRLPARRRRCLLEPRLRPEQVVITEARALRAAGMSLRAVTALHTP